MKCCPTCGQSVPSEFELNGVHLTPMQKQILEIVRKAGKWGVSTELIRDRVYAEHPDGGPLTADNVIYVQICALNKKLSTLHKKIEPRGGCKCSSPYVLKDVS